MVVGASRVKLEVAMLLVMQCKRPQRGSDIEKWETRGSLALVGSRQRATGTCRYPSMPAAGGQAGFPRLHEAPQGVLQVMCCHLLAMLEGEGRYSGPLKSLCTLCEKSHMSICA